MLPAINLYLLASLVFVVTFMLFIPFISLLYRLNIKDPEREMGRKDRFGDFVNIFDKIKGYKSGTPTGGGILIVLVVLLVFAALRYFSAYEIDADRFNLYLLGILIFGFIGLYDDLKKVFKFKGLALRVRHKFLIQMILGLVVAYFGVTKGLFFIEIPFLGYVVENQWLLLALSALTIVFMSNAFNIIDGIDGLSSGSLLITLIPITIFVKHSTNNLSDLVLIFIIIGAVLAYLYFNIKPARLFMGDTGALALGAVMGLLTLMTGTLYLLPVFGLVYVVDSFSSVIQWFTKLYFNGKKFFKIAPIHHHFEAIGWEDTKVVFRFWLAHVFCSLLGLGIYFLFV
ncbi:phospho-N-acetylmuramoyl-pentapeptide-transferase [Patescibacteria group bacterium]